MKEPMRYPQPGKTARARVRGVRHPETGETLHILTNRVMVHAIARDLKGDGADALSRMDMEAGRPVEIS